MRKIRKLMPVWLLFSLLLTLVVPVKAAIAIETTHPASLTILCRQDGTPVNGVMFAIYRVADVDAYAEFTLTGDFAAYPVVVNGLDQAAWRVLAGTLAGFVQRDNLKPLDSGRTDSSGSLTFPTSAASTLLPGLYLVTGQAFYTERYAYTPEPFLICLPNLDEKTDIWQYAVTLTPKCIQTRIPPVPEEETVNRRVQKIWRGEGQEQARPEEITVELLCNGAVYETARLNEQNNWRHAWEKLPVYDASGNWIDWRVVEQTPAGYTVTVSQEAETFVVVNTSDKQPEKPGYEPELPNTGVLWWPVPVLLAAGILLVTAGAFAGKRKHNG